MLLFCDNMKRIFTTIIAIAMAIAAFAQTPEEIVSLMEQEMSKHEKDGLSMVLDVKLPILGTLSTKSYVLGQKSRWEATMQGKTIIYWNDGNSEWSYDCDAKKIVVKKTSVKSDNSGNNKELLDNISNGYDLSLTKETNNTWYIHCKKAKGNNDSDAPKSMDLAISKATHYPLSISTKVKGIATTMRDFGFGVTEKQVTFNPADYPDATIVDER